MLVSLLNFQNIKTQIIKNNKLKEI